MYFNSLSITDFRNIRQAEIDLNPKLNIFYGKNGSGKTSVLEALSLLSCGRSFRSSLIAPLINHDCTSTTVFARLADNKGSETKLGISKHRTKGTSIKYNNGAINSSSQLARLLPFQTVDGSSFSFLEGGTKYRRSLLDWLVFHVEQSFLDTSKEFYGALKQRNALLRRGIIEDGQLSIWSDKFISIGVSINELRKTVFESVLTQLEQFTTQDVQLDVEFSNGWGDSALRESLVHSLSGDIDRRTTRVGPHRADIVFKTNNKKAVDILSRGQKKKLILLFYLAVIREFENRKDTVINVGLDDLTAELDHQTVADILSRYLNVNSQLFITVIDPQAVVSVIPKDINYTLFHVEQGVITQVDNP